MRIKNWFIAYLFLVLCALLVSRMSYAFDVGQWISSNTATADSTVTLCSQFSLASGSTTIVVPQQATIHAVIISSAIPGASIQLYDSSYTVLNSSTVGPIMGSSLGTYTYDTTFRHGLCYVKSGTGVAQILYQCF